MDRTQRILAILLALQLAVLAVLGFAFPSNRGPAKEASLLPALAGMTPRKVEIGDQAGASVTLARAGGGWTLESPSGYPADSAKVEKLLDDLEAVKVRSPVVSNRRNHAALKVADETFERRVRIWEKPEDKPSATLYVGSSPRFQSSHVRVGGKDPVYEASGINTFELAADPGSWVERSLVAVPADSVTSLSLRNAKGGFELEKKDGLWSVRAPASRARAALDAQKVETLVRTLCSMSLDAPAGPAGDAAYGLATPESAVALWLGTTPGVEVRIGAQVPGNDNQRYAGRAGSPYAVIVSKYTVDRALNATLTELLAK